MIRLATIAAAFLVGTAGAATIDFETLSDGLTAPTQGTSAETEYSAQGVTFAGGGFAGQPSFRAFFSLSNVIAMQPPASNQMFITTQQRLPGEFFDIEIFFSAPVVSASGDVIIHPNYSAEATAYDAADAVLGSVVIPAGASTWIAGSFSFSGIGAISRIHVVPSSVIATVGLDNLAFTPQAVPEPSAALLMGAGLAIVAARRRIRG